MTRYKQTVPLLTHWFTGWVGDQDPTFDGLQRALENYFHSAWDGYVNFGSDIGGYRTGKGVLGRTKELFIRWAQLGALSPLMENGGNKEHRPWMFDDETLQIYRNFVNLHMSLKPYFLTVGSNALASNYSAITPMSKYTFVVTNWNYLLGPDVSSDVYFIQIFIATAGVRRTYCQKQYRALSGIPYGLRLGWLVEFIAHLSRRFHCTADSASCFVSCVQTCWLVDSNELPWHWPHCSHYTAHVRP